MPIVMASGVQIEWVYNLN